MAAGMSGKKKKRRLSYATEMKLEDALKKFLQGKKVLAAPARAMDPGKERYLFRSLESILNENASRLRCRLVENPDFKEAVHQMVTPEKLPPQETIREEPEVAPMEINKNMTQEPSGYTGFLHIRCEHCGKTKTLLYQTSA
ncbi:MAG: hypothetical protein ACLTML_14355 [Blautia faecis]